MSSTIAATNIATGRADYHVILPVSLVCMIVAVIIACIILAIVIFIKRLHTVIMNMNKPLDEPLKQRRNRSWLLVKVRQTEDARYPLHVMLVLIEMLYYSSYLYQNFSDNITEICHGLSRTDNIPQYDIRSSSQESSFCEYI
jgi:hypothetical protein